MCGKLITLRHWLSSHTPSWRTTTVVGCIKQFTQTSAHKPQLILESLVRKWLTSVLVTWLPLMICTQYPAKRTSVHQLKIMWSTLSTAAWTHVRTVLQALSTRLSVGSTLELRYHNCHQFPLKIATEWLGLHMKIAHKISHFMMTSRCHRIEMTPGCPCWNQGHPQKIRLQIRSHLDEDTTMETMYQLNVPSERQKFWNILTSQQQPSGRPSCTHKVLAQAVSTAVVQPYVFSW